MLKQSSAQLGVNLAQIMLEHRKSLTPTPSTLLQELCFNSYNPMKLTELNVKDIDSNVIRDYIVSGSEGSNYESSNGTKSYNGSAHDSYMDNYVSDLTNLVSNHLQYARSVVYPKVQHLAESVQTVVSNSPVKSAEDFFSVSFYKLPDLFRTSFMEEEVYNYTPSTASISSINFGDSFNDFDFLPYVSTGDSETDTAISTLVSSIGVEKTLSYVRNTSADTEYTLSHVELLNYAVINFLFYRALTVKQDMAKGLGVIQLVTKATSNRNYYAKLLKTTVNQHDMFLRQGTILTNDTDVNFSYLSDKQYKITVYEESFQKAAEQGATIDHLFGFIANTTSPYLTVDMIKSDGDMYLRTWNTIRGLYVAHVGSNRDSVVRMAFRMGLPSALEYDCSEEETAFYTANQGFKEKTIELCNSYINNLPPKALDNIPEVALHLIAEIGFRHSNAFQLIDGMLTMMAEDSKLTMQDAALFTQVRYLTDFMLEQADITS